MTLTDKDQIAGVLKWLFKICEWCPGKQRVSLNHSDIFRKGTWKHRIKFRSNEMRKQRKRKTSKSLLQ